MFYVGGNAGKSNIEVHDIQFVAARECVFRSERSWIGIEVRSVFRIYSINRDALTFSTAF
jgi:hypothetical protein